MAITIQKNSSNLGTWLDRQRRAQAKGTLHPANQRKLTDAGVTFWDIEQRGGTHSQKWEDMFRRLVQYRQREGHSCVPQSYKDHGKNLGTWLNTQRQSKKHGTLDFALVEKLESVDGFMWKVSPGTLQWEGMFSLLRDYRDRAGDCNVPKDHVVVVEEEEEKRLGAWLVRQRRSKKKGTLDANRRKRLERLGVVWDYAHQWEEMFALLRDYREREGHCNVPRRYKASLDDVNSDGDDCFKNLGTWLQTQRRFKREGALDPKREERLERFGIEWEVYCKWNEMFTLLVRYKEREGDCLVPWNHKEDGKNLGIWLNNQRSTKTAGRKGRLSKQQCSDLEQLGVVWFVAEAQWDSMAALLVQYRRRTGHCRVPQSHKEDGKNLGTWLNSQRRAKRSGNLDKAREQTLREIGMVWSVATDTWDEMFSLLLEYKKREGDCFVPPKHKEDQKALGAWLDTQRKSQKKGTLDPSNKERLESIGVVWDKLAYNREEMISRLIEYKEREGDCCVPRSHTEDGKGLGVWLNRQRKLHKSGDLDPLLRRRLEHEGVVLDVNGQRWETMFALLVRFQEREGHCRVPQDRREGEQKKKLGRWLDRQRQKKKQEKLDTALQTRLETIGVEWNIYHAASHEYDDNDDWGFEGMDHLFDDDNMKTYY